VSLANGKNDLAEKEWILTKLDLQEEKDISKKMRTTRTGARCVQKKNEM